MSTVSSRNTKSDILNAYNNLLKEYKSLQQDHDALKKQKAAVAATGGSSAAPARRAPAADGEPTSTDIGGIIKGLIGLRSGLGISTSSLQQRLTTEASRLADLRQEANAIISDLNSLHDIEEINDKTLDNLVADYKTISEKFQDELSEHREAAELEQEEASDTWKREQDEHRRLTRERDAQLKKTRDREAAEYEYDLSQRRAVDEDAYQLTLKQAKSELDALKEAKDIEWTEREESIAKQETEFAELQTKVEALPAQKTAALKKAKEEGANVAKRQAKIKADLLNAEIQGKENVYQLRVDKLEETISKNNTLIEDLTTQLRTAQRQAQELAVKAIEGASNERSFLAVKEIALEQAKTPSKGK